LQARWQNEKEVILKLREGKEKLETMRHDEEVATRRGQLEKAAKSSYGKLPALEKRIARSAIQLKKVQGDGALLNEEVTEEHIAKHLALDGHPHHETDGRREGQAATYEENLRRRLVGQEEAVEAVSNAIRRAKAGLQDPNRPLGSFLFLVQPAWARRNSPKRSRIPL